MGSNSLPSSTDNPITVILVPQGAEHQAVLKGLKKGIFGSSDKRGSTYPQVIPIPIGPVPVQRYLQKIQDTGDRLHPDSTVLLMGLGGSLDPDLAVGTVTLLESCIAEWADAQPMVKSDCLLLNWLQENLEHDTKCVQGVTSQHLISSAQEKTLLHQQLKASIVDMEGYCVLQFCQAQGMKGGVLRVVSDDCVHNVPDVNNAISPEGTLRTVPLALGLMRQPIAAVRLIRGSMAGLRVLNQVTQQLFSPKSGRCGVAISP